MNTDVCTSAGKIPRTEIGFVSYPATKATISGRTYRPTDSPSPAHKPWSQPIGYSCSPLRDGPASAAQKVSEGLRK